jgi:hypothetical protein
MYSGHSTPCYYPSATTKNQIIEALAMDKHMLREIKKICKCTDVDDLMQIIYIYLLEMKDGIITTIHGKKQLKWFIIRLVLNQINSTTSLYYRQYKRNSQKYDPVLMGHEVGIDWNLDAINEIALKEIEKLPFYQRNIFNLVAENPDKTFPQLGEEYNIKGYSVFYTYNKVRQKLKKSIRKNDL